MTIPLTIVGGYLGTGKTTLINNILKKTNKKIAVLVNDFGSINIDESLIEWQEDNLISIAGGCICCSYGNELIETLEQMKTIDPLPDHIILEASGVAIPYKISQTISLLDYLSLYGILILADASRVLRQLEDTYISDTIRNQFVNIDVLVLNKIDLVNDKTLETCVMTLNNLDNNVKLLQTKESLVSQKIIFQNYSKKTSGNNLEGIDSSFSNSNDFSTITLDCSKKINKANFVKLLTDSSYGVERAKGYIKTETEDYFLLQYDSQNIELKPINFKKELAIVIIGKKGLFNADKFILNFNEILK